MNSYSKTDRRVTNSDGAYFQKPQEIYKVQTDINIFPYNRFFGYDLIHQSLSYGKEKLVFKRFSQTFEKSSLFFEKDQSEIHVSKLPVLLHSYCNGVTSFKKQYYFLCLYKSIKIENM